MTTPDDTRPALDDLLEGSTRAAADLIAGELESFKRQEGWRDRSYDFGLSLAAALRDSGWVDPEETAKRAQKLTASGKLAERLSTHVMSAIAQRDALLPVVEAAKAYAEAVADPSLATIERVERLIAAVDALESREESTDGR